jgi:hypothetical protein
MKAAREDAHLEGDDPFPETESFWEHRIALLENYLKSCRFRCDWGSIRRDRAIQAAQFHLQEATQHLIHIRK